MAKDKGPLIEGFRLKSESGYAKLIIKDFPASKARTIVKELAELGKAIEVMQEAVSECDCPSCTSEAVEKFSPKRRERQVVGGALITIRKQKPTE